jgi:putative membrane protein
MQNKSMQRLVFLSASAILLAATSAAFAQAPASSDDKRFVKAALQGGLGEIELGKLAAEKGNSDDVKQFGQKMVDDHGKMGETMTGVAQQVGVTPPTGLSVSEEAEKAKLNMLSGESFDKAYISAMVKDHEADLKDFRKEANGGSSPAVKSAAHDGETVVSHHLMMIRKIAQAHNVSASYQKPSAGMLAVVATNGR